MKKDLKWAVLGTGIIANEMAQALEKMGKKIYAVANRTHEKALDFAKKYGVEKVYDKIEDMFYDDETDIIYITTPHNTHIKFMIEALKNGKHVLCEKSITLNSEELEEAVKLAKEKNLILGEAMTIFNMPLYAELLEIVNSGKLGDVKMIQVNFGSYKEYDMTNRFFNRNLAGGALLDIGVYAISITRLFMASKPNNVLSQAKYAPREREYPKFCVNSKYNIWYRIVVLSSCFFVLFLILLKKSLIFLHFLILLKKETNLKNFFFKLVPFNFKLNKTYFLIFNTTVSPATAVPSSTPFKSEYSSKLEIITGVIIDLALAFKKS